MHKGIHVIFCAMINFALLSFQGLGYPHWKFIYKVHRSAARKVIWISTPTIQYQVTLLPDSLGSTFLEWTSSKQLSKSFPWSFLLFIMIFLSYWLSLWTSWFPQISKFFLSLAKIVIFSHTQVQYLMDIAAFWITGISTYFSSLMFTSWLLFQEWNNSAEEWAKDRKLWTVTSWHGIQEVVGSFSTVERGGNVNKRQKLIQRWAIWQCFAETYMKHQRI
jgi:hypothetical protein